MLTHSAIGHLTVPDQYFSYATAYRSAAAVLCAKMKIDDAFSTWPHAAVVLMLAAHAVELFLKGALLKRNVEVQAFNHSIDQLAAKYKETFQEESFTWDIPFTPTLTEAEWIAQMMQLNPDTNEAELKAMISASPDPSVLYRYPVNKDGNNRPGVYGLEPTSFLLRLHQVESDFKRIRGQLD